LKDGKVEVICSGALSSSLLLKPLDLSGELMGRAEAYYEMGELKGLRELFDNLLSSIRSQTLEEIK
jgi:hypothetical protein